MLPTEEEYEGVWATRVEFSSVSADGPVSLKVTILGCAEGMTPLISSRRKTDKELQGT